MHLQCPPDQPSINVGGVEYTGVDGVVVINDPSHIAAAQSNGFVELEDDADPEFTGE